MWHEIADVQHWPSWWRGISATTVVRKPGLDGLGQRTFVVVRSPLGYRLAFGVEIVEADAPHLARARVVGDLVGTGEWSVLPDGGGSRATIRWDVSPEREPLRTLATPFAAPLTWAHAWVMANGEASLAERIKARSANT